MYFLTWMLCVLLALFISLRNLYISLESIRKRHTSKITHSFKVSLYSSNDNKRKTKSGRQKKKKKKKTTKTIGPYAESNHVRTKVYKYVYLSNHYNLCATINHCQWHLTKRYSISILMKNTGCSLERSDGGQKYGLGGSNINYLFRLNKCVFGTSND